MNELKLFRPSSAPGVELCGHFTPSISTSPNALRGTRIHEVMAKLWREEYTLDDVPQDLWEPIDYAYGELSPLFTTAEEKGIEEKVTLFDEFDEFITEGTLDLWGRWTKPKSVTVLVDYKSGQERDYSAQLWTYALPLINKLSVDEIQLITLFVDQKRSFNESVTRTQLEDRVWQIVAKAEDPRAPHVINRYCDFCDLRFRCPAWEEEKTLAVDMLPGSVNQDIVRELSLAPSFEMILADANLLGRFLVAYKHLRKLVEKTWTIEARAIEIINSGVELPGCQLVNNPGAETIDPQKFFELVRKHMDANQLLGLARTIDNDAARQIFDNLQSQRLLDKKTALPTKKATSSSYIRIKE